MSLCDKCYAPGHCCKGLCLNGLRSWSDEGLKGAKATAEANGLPFDPVEELWRETDPETGREYSEYWWNCPKLSPKGRCTIYAKRPSCCRNYEPASDGLCCHFQGAEGDERNVL